MNPAPETESRMWPAVLLAFAAVVVLKIFSLAVMIAAIVIGAIHLHDCSVQPYIPIYLLVTGVFSLLSLGLTSDSSSSSDDAASASTVTGGACKSLVHLFNFCWLIAGTVWVYPHFPPNAYMGPGSCDKTTFYFAFSYITLQWSVLAIMFICGFCIMCVAICVGAEAGRRLLPARYSFYGETGGGTTAGDV